MKKNGNALGDNDAAELECVSYEANGLQKCLENVRKQSRQHGMIMNDHRQKKQKALEAAGMPVQQAQAMAVIGDPQVELDKNSFFTFCDVSLTFFLIVAFLFLGNIVLFFVYFHEKLSLGQNHPLPPPPFKYVFM